MSRYDFVLAEGTFSDVSVERSHLAGQPVDIRLARLASEEDLRRETGHANGIIVTTNPLPRRFLECLGPNVAVIGRAGVGLDAIDVDAARDLGIAVFHCPDYCTQEVATHALALVLALHRRIVEGNAVARNDWTAWRRLTPFTPIHQLTAGIVGCGRIGRAVMAGLNPLVRHIVGYDPLTQAVPAGVERVDTLAELLGVSDVISLHIPLTADTRHLINAQTLELMKSSAILVNVSRGGLIDEQALVVALASGRLAGAALDVLEQEPPEPASALLQAPNVLLSPHFAWYSSEAERRARTITLDGMLAYLEGQLPIEGRLAAVPDSSRSRLRRIAANRDPR